MYAFWFYFQVWSTRITFKDSDGGDISSSTVLDVLTIKTPNREIK